MKTMGRKKSQIVVKRHRTKKAPQKVAKKNFSGLHIWYIYLSHGSYDLQLSSYKKKLRMNWNGDNWTIQNITWLADEKATLSVQNVSWKYWWPEQNYMTLQNHRQPTDN